MDEALKMLPESTNLFFSVRCSTKNHIWRVKLGSFKPEKMRVSWGHSLNPRVRNTRVPDVTLQLTETHEGNEHFTYCCGVWAHTHIHTKVELLLLSLES